MALWTPYADDTVLDLSKSKDPHEYPQNPQEEYLQEYPREYPQDPIYHFGYTAPQLSPLSAASISSYERPFTPTNRLATLSPPISPASLKRTEDSLSDDPDFQAFERDALRAMAEKNGGALLGNNPRMRRTVRSNNDSNDDSYRRQRERNNFAAKQSRDRRKLREIHLALKVTYLRKELASLKAVLASRACGRCRQSCIC